VHPSSIAVATDYTEFVSPIAIIVATFSPPCDYYAEDANGMSDHALSIALIETNEKELGTALCEQENWSEEYWVQKKKQE